MSAEFQIRHDFFEPGDLSALVCVEEPEVQRIVFQQLEELGYKIHTGLFGDDVSLKLRSYPYNVVIAYETFGGGDVEMNQVLIEGRLLPMSQRRRQFFVALGPDMVTGDEMQAFSLSVELTVGVADLNHLGIALRRGVQRNSEMYERLNQCLSLLGMD
jgi:hypothetical protein